MLIPEVHIARDPVRLISHLHLGSKGLVGTLDLPA
jgi:hypothetical protein